MGERGKKRSEMREGAEQEQEGKEEEKWEEG